MSTYEAAERVCLVSILLVAAATGCSGGKAGGTGGAGGGAGAAAGSGGSGGSGAGSGGSGTGSGGSGPGSGGSGPGSGGSSPGSGGSGPGSGGAGGGNTGTGGRGSTGGAGGATSSCTPVADRAISEAPGRSGRPSLAAAGDGGFGVVWPDDRGGVEHLYFARLDRAGAKVGAETPITSGATATTLPALVSAGATFGLSFVTEAVPPAMIHFARLDAQGAVQGSIVDVAEGAGVSSLVWSGAHYALAYHSSRGGAQTEIFVSRFDAAGARVGAELPLTADPAASFIPSIAWSGSRYGIVFTDSRSGMTEVFLGIVDASGAEVGQEAPLAAGGAARIGASATSFAVTFSGGQGPRLARLDAAGRRTVEDVPIGGAPAEVVWTGTRYAFAWSAGGGPVYLATIDETAAAPSSSLLVSAAAAAAMVNSVFLAWTGSGYAVAWADGRSGTPEIHFALACPP